MKKSFVGDGSVRYMVFLCKYRYALTEDVMNLISSPCMLKNLWPGMMFASQMNS
jgi:hypothetical protein